MRFETEDVDFCLAVIKAGKLRQARDLGIQPDMLHDEGRVMWECILQFHKEHKKVPTLDWVLRETGVEIDTEHKLDPIDALGKKIRSNHLGTVLVRETKAVHKMLQEKDSARAAVRLRAAAEHIRSVMIDQRQNVINNVDPRQVALRVARYKKMKEFKGAPDGITTCWSSLDKETLGWHPKELIVMAGKEKIGKTFWLTRCAVEARKQGKVALYVELEMPIEQVQERIDAMEAEISFPLLRKGKLGTAGEKKYARYLNGLVNKKQVPLHIVDNTTVRTIDEIAGLALDLQADIVFIDGLYILGRTTGGGNKESGGKGGGRDIAMWERVLNSSADAKEFAKITKLPWVVTTQFASNLEADALEASTNQLGYAKAIAQWADMVFGIFMNDDFRRENIRLIRTLCARNFEPVHLLVNWDLDTQDFSEIGAFEGDNISKLQGLLSTDKDEKATTATAVKKPAPLETVRIKF